MSEKIDETSTANHDPASRKFGVFLPLLAIIVVAVAAVAAYLQLVHMNKSTTHTVHALQQQISAMHADMAAVQQTMQKIQDVSAKQEQMMSDFQNVAKGDLNKWYVAEAQYLTKLANDHLQFGQNVTMALTLLQRAEQVLQDLPDPALTELRKSIASDIASLQAVPNADVSELYVRLTTTNNEIDQLPFSTHPVQVTGGQKAPAMVQLGTPWYQVMYDRMMEALRKIVIVRNVDASALPLVMPEEKVFLYQNLHAQMEAILWAVLHHDADVYQASLTRMLNWVTTYFDQNADATKNMLQSLRDYQKVNLKTPSVSMAVTLQLFDTYFSTATPSQTPTTTSTQG